MRTALALSLPLLASCVPQPYVSARYTPRSVVREAAVADQAVMVYEDDARALLAAGGRPVGSISLTGTGAFHPRAACEAAEHGATHYLVADEGTDVHAYEMGPATSTTAVDPGGQSLTTTHRPALKVYTTTDHMAVVAFRVDPDRWAELPKALRPDSRGKGERGFCR